MTEQERAQLIRKLERAAEQAQLHIVNQHPLYRGLLRHAANRIRADGFRLKAQSQMAVTLNDTMEQALAALATFKKQCRCRS